MLVDVSRPFASKLTGRRLSVAAAAISRRWSVNTLSECFGLNPRTVRTLRDGRHGRYKPIHESIKRDGVEFAIKAYIDDDTIRILNETERQLKLFGSI